MTFDISIIVSMIMIIVIAPITPVIVFIAL